MSPGRRTVLLSAVLLLLAGGTLSLPAVHWRLIGWWRGEAFYQGRPTIYWSGRVREWTDLSWTTWKGLDPPTDAPLNPLREAVGLESDAQTHVPAVLGNGEDRSKLDLESWEVPALDPAAVPVLLELRRNEDPWVRLAATRAFTLHEITDRRVVPALIAVWQADESAMVRGQAADAAHRRDPEAAAAAGIDLDVVLGSRK